ncbi:MAG TPA: cobalamin-binding protein [Solirubrobacterales bacterium]|nr:cobalamin-binding protein [Solirubrobacterales bacterium]
MRIASLVPSATEMVYALGLENDLVGVTHECDWPPAAQRLPQLTATVIPAGLNAGEIDRTVKATIAEGRALYTLDEERLAELEPDLIVAQAVCEVCAVSYEDVVSIAARMPSRPRVLQLDPSTLSDVLADTVKLGEAAYVPDRGRELRRELEARLAAVRIAVTTTSRPRVIALEWLDPPFVGGHWVPEMIALAGGEDLVGTAGVKSAEVSWERLSVLEPDVVVVMPCGWYIDDSRAQAIACRERLAALGAERVYAVDAASSFSRPGPRLIDGVELLSHLLHHEYIPPPLGIEFEDVTAEVTAC